MFEERKPVYFKGHIGNKGSTSPYFYHLRQYHSHVDVILFAFTVERIFSEQAYNTLPSNEFKLRDEYPEDGCEVNTLKIYVVE
jgi:hypothetical protein